MLTQKVKKHALAQMTTMADDPDFNYMVAARAIGGSVDACGIKLRDGRFIDALVTARDVLGNWTVVLLDGGIRQYLAEEVY